MYSPRPSKRAIVGTGVLRDQPLFQARIAEAVALVRSARAWLHTAVQQAWASTLTSGTASVAERADLFLAAVNATRSAAEAVQLVYTVAGGTANYRHSALQRALRDVHAVTQHIGTAPQQYEDAGRMVLGWSLYSRFCSGKRPPAHPGQWYHALVPSSSRRSRCISRWR